MTRGPAIILASLLWVPAEAQPRTEWNFVAVDSVETNGWALHVTGIVQGESAPTTYSFNYGDDRTFFIVALEACHRNALVAMSKPGQFRLELRLGQYYEPPSCKLIRATP